MERYWLPVKIGAMVVSLFVLWAVGFAWLAGLWHI